jgi:hypothetical protein
MRPDVEEQVTERLARLEEKVDALDRRLDRNAELLKSDIHAAVEAVVALSDEMRRATNFIRTEHTADREAFRLATKHLRRF